MGAKLSRVTEKDPLGPGKATLADPAPSAVTQVRSTVFSNREERLNEAAVSPLHLVPRGSSEPATLDARYEMREMLGEGGMGKVHLVLDRRMGREVALKAIHPDQASRPELRSRFVREAKIQAQLEHPSIVPVYELCADGDDAYFTMRRVRGVTLEQVIEGLTKGKDDSALRFSQRKLLTAFGNVCLAVDFAHARGIVHRDLKPANVMLGQFGEVHVLDWGIAKVPEADHATGESLLEGDGTPARTAVGTFLGTLGFVSPEQLRGEPVTASSDVYSLGAILFELLAHKPLHEGSRAADLVNSTLGGVDARPSMRAPDLGIPPELDAVCVKATQLDPVKRYASARELNKDIERFLDGDRDVEQRRELAQRHARLAGEAVSRAAESADPDAERIVALREAARALALDPMNDAALDVTLRLRAQPPKKFPPEVDARLARSRAGFIRVSARTGFWLFLLLLAVFPLVQIAGILELGWLAATCGLLGLCALVLFARGRKPQSWQMPVFIFVGNLAIALFTRVAGPFILVPALVVASTVAFAMLYNPADRRLALLAGCAAILVPTALEWTGTFGSSYVFHDGMFTVLPHAQGLPRAFTFVGLTLTSIMALVAVFSFVSRLRADLHEKERTITLQAWQFRQLLPEPIRDAAEAAPVKKACGAPVSKAKP
jgi:eukaryotic-like serine/threonine-protein kinase